MIKRYYIVPKGSYHLVMGLTEDGVYLKVHKTVATSFDCTLIFSDAETAQKYIEEYLDIEKYEVEPFWTKKIEDVDCDGRCLNCDYFDFISGECTIGRE